jgi:hypothetical protein
MYTSHRLAFGGLLASSFVFAWFIASNGAEGPDLRPQTRYESPNAVFNAFKEAREKRDARRVFSLLTRKCQDREVFEAYFECGFEAANESKKGSSSEGEAILAKFVDKSLVEDAEKEYKKRGSMGSGRR